MTWDTGPPSKFKSWTPEAPSKFKSGTPGSPTKFKSETPLPFFNEFIFFRIFLCFFYLFIFVSFLNKIQKNINCELQKSIVNTKDKQVYVTTKKLSEETEQNPSEPHSLAVLFKVYL